jgi:hypothetical protein
MEEFVLNLQKLQSVFYLAGSLCFVVGTLFGFHIHGIRDEQYRLQAANNAVQSPASKHAANSGDITNTKSH